MKQGYIIARIDVHDAETYAKYTAQTPIVAAQFGGEFIVRGGQCEQAESAGGVLPQPRISGDSAAGACRVQPRTRYR